MGKTDLAAQNVMIPFQIDGLKLLPKEAVSSPAVTSCVGKLFVIGGGPDDNTCSDKVSHVFLQK